jgi:broad specificity phosphatase PhoE
MEVYLIRHGETDSNVSNGHVRGRSNHLPLNQNGLDQARRLGERLKRTNHRFDAIYSSIALRTLQTAARVCEIIGFPKDRIIQSELLQEIHQGDWEGKTKKEIYTPAMLETINRDHWNFQPPQGESQKMVEERMLQWLNRLKPIPPNETDALKVGVFTHGFSIRCLLRGLLDFDCDQTYRMEIQNTSITKLKFKDGEWIPLSINDSAHLEP